MKKTDIMRNSGGLIPNRRYALWLMSAMLLMIVFIVSSCCTHRQAAKYGAPPVNYQDNK